MDTKQKETVSTEDNQAAVPAPEIPIKKKGGKGYIIFGILGFLLTAIAGTAIFLFLTYYDKDSTKDLESSEKTALYSQEPDESMVIDTKKWGQAPSNEVILMLKDGYGKKEADEIAQSIDGEVVGEIEEFNLFQILTNATSEAALVKNIDEVENNELVDIVLPDLVQFTKETKGVACSMYEDSYSEGKFSIPYKMIGVEKAWQYINASGVSLNKVQVGVVDSGLNAGYIDQGSDVKFQILAQKDLRSDSETHGTDIANIIGGTWENGGMQGVAGGLGDKLNIVSSNIHAVKVPKTVIVDPKDITQTIFKGKTYIYKSFIEIKKQIDAGSTVINFSQGPDKPEAKNKLMSTVYKIFLQKVAIRYPEVLFVTSAGNENGKLNGENYSMAGIKLPNVITVGGLDNKGDKAEHSNISTGDGEVTLATSSMDIPNGLNAEGKLFTASGTSFAAPQVAASVAILQSINDKLTAAEIKKILVKTASSSIADTEITKNEKQIPTGLGGKVLRLDKAVLEALKGLPADQRPENISEEYFSKLSSITATATAKPDDPLSYDISALLSAVQKDGTTATINLQGEGLIGGMSSQKLSSAGSVQWGFSFPESEDSMDATILITRQDSKACTRLSLTSAPKTLIFKGTFIEETTDSGIISTENSTAYLRIYTVDDGPEGTMAKFSYGENLRDGWPTYLVSHSGNHYVFESSTRSFVERVRIVIDVTDAGMTGTVTNITPDISSFVRGTLTGKSISFEQYSAAVLN